jgi:hypothetical protein
MLNVGAIKQNEINRPKRQVRLSHKRKDHKMKTFVTGLLKGRITRWSTLAGLLVFLTLPGRGGVFLYENFDGTLPAPPVGWAADSTQILDPLWGFVPGVGVGGTTAMQISGTFIDYGGYIGMLYQNPAITGNAGATPANTKLAFDMKVNVPDIYGFSVSVQGWRGGWAGIATGSTMDIFTWPGYPSSDYDLPEEFQTIHWP